MCGKEYVDGTRGPESHMRMNFYVLLSTGKPLDTPKMIGNGMQPTMISGHTCGSGRTGVSDLIGITEYDKDPGL